MKLARTVAITVAPANLADLVDDELRQCDEVVLQAPTGNAADIFFGNKGEQPGFIAAGGSITMLVSSLKNIYVRGTLPDTIIILVPR